MENKLETDIIRQSIFDAHVREVAPWCAVCLIGMLLCFAAHTPSTALCCMFLAGFLIIREYAKYASERYALTLPHTTEKAPTPKETIRLICEQAGVKPPALGTVEKSLGAMYDPNTETITLGDMLDKGDGAVASAVHECAHHILLSADPITAQRRRKMLAAANAAQTAALVMSVTFVVLIVLGSGGSALAFRLFLASMLFSKAAITTHEYDTNNYAVSLIESDEGALGIVDKERAIKYLRLCERTYTVDFWGWVGVALFASMTGIGV